MDSSFRRNDGDWVQVFTFGDFTVFWIPAFAGMTGDWVLVCTFGDFTVFWIPAFAGMTGIGFMPRLVGETRTSASSGRP